MPSVTSRRRRTIEPKPRFAAARLLIAAALLAGLFGMHGLSNTTTTTTLPAVGGASVAAAMPMPATAASASTSVLSAAHAVLSSDAALAGMPMPGGGHGSPDMLHACLAVLSTLAALALLVMAVTRARTHMTRVALQEPRSRRRLAEHRDKPLRLSITQLGISRT